MGTRVPIIIDQEIGIINSEVELREEDSNENYNGELKIFSKFEE